MGDRGYFNLSADGDMSDVDDSTDNVRDLRHQLQSLSTELTQLRSTLNMPMGMDYFNWRANLGSHQQPHNFDRSTNGSISSTRSAVVSSGDRPPPLPPRLNKPQKNVAKPLPNGGFVAQKQFHSNLDLSYPSTSRPPEIPAKMPLSPPLPLPPKSPHLQRLNLPSYGPTIILPETAYNQLIKNPVGSVKQGSLVQTNGTLYSTRISSPGKMPPTPEKLITINCSPRTNVTHKHNRVDTIAATSELEDMTDVTSEEQMVKLIRSTRSSWVKLGPTLLFINRTGVPQQSQLFLEGTSANSTALVRLTDDIVGRLADGVATVSVVLNGESGTGKSTVSRQLLEQMFVAFDKTKGTSSAVYQGIEAGSTVVQYFSTTYSNQDGIKGHVAILYELGTSNRDIYKAKLSCCFPDPGRLVRPDADRENFLIFYLMIYGLSAEEKSKFHLQGYAESDLNFLQREPHQITGREKQQLMKLKSCLTLLGIPLSDVFRVLAAILLLGNISIEDDLKTVSSCKKELDAVSALLGITNAGLTQALMNSTKTVGLGKTVTMAHSNSTVNRDALAKTLFYRCVTAIIRRANSYKSSPTAANSPNSTASSSDESSHPDSGIGLVSPTAKSKFPSNDSNLSTEGSVAILDSFGIRDNKRNHFEEFCVNLAAEKLQHAVRQKLLTEVANQMRLEEVGNNLNTTAFHWHELEDVVEIFSPRTGLLSLVDEVSQTLQPTTLEAAVRKKFKDNKMLSVSGSNNNRLVITHYGSYEIQYDTHDFPEVNRDLLSTDLIKVFDRRTCNFGFVSYLFSPDLKRIEELENSSHKQKLSYYPRIIPNCGSETWFSGSKHTTLTQDFHSRMNGFLKVTLGAEMVNIINCIKTSNAAAHNNEESIQTNLLRQIRRSHLVPIAQFSNSGFPYIEKFNLFNRRYRFLLSKYQRLVFRLPSSNCEESRAILDCYLKAVDESYLPYVSNHWLIGTASVFVSEGAHGQLETLRDLHRQKAAVIIQLRLRKWLANSRNMVKPTTVGHSRRGSSSCRPLPIVGTQDESLLKPFPLSPPQYNSTPISTTINPPTLPMPRAYSIEGSLKLSFPQRRVMVQSHRVPNGNGPQLKDGDIVTAVGWSNIRGHIIVEFGAERFPCSVPYCITKLSSMARSANV